VSTSVNISKSIGAVGAAAAVQHLEGVRPPSLDEALIAGALYVLITLAPIAAMVGWTQGRAAVVGFIAREWLPTITLAAIGALAAAIWVTTPFLIALLAFPLAMVEIAARSSSRARVAEQRLVRALEAQRVFAADAAHELRNPLAAIRGNIAYVEPEHLPRDQAEALVQAKDDSESLSALVERLLLLSKTDRPASGTSNVADAVARATATVRPRETVALEVRVPDDLEVAVGRELMDARVRDIAENAAAYTERGRIAITGERRAKSAVLVISDTGIGIAPEELPRVFDRFFRGSSARKLAHGSGLGLAIARRIAEAYGGELTIDSAPGRGTRVTVTLPLAS
jgi:signal transduction histidine kinase